MSLLLLILLSVRTGIAVSMVIPRSRYSLLLVAEYTVPEFVDWKIIRVGMMMTHISSW